MLQSETPTLAVPPAHQIRRYASWTRRGVRARSSELAWRVEAGAAEEAPQFILPHGEPSLALVLREGEDARLFVCGASGEARLFDPAPDMRMAALQLTPERAHLLDIDPASRQEWQAPPKALEQAARPLLDSLAGCEADEALQALSAWFDALCAGQDLAERPEERAMRLLRRAGGRLSMAALAGQVGACECGLRRRFRDRIGLTPKAYARQIRLSAAIRAADALARPAWAQIAVEHGYFDQAHLISEARALTGLTPTALIARRGACPKSPIAARAA